MAASAEAIVKAYTVTIKASIGARNLSSAQAKLRSSREHMQRKGFLISEVGIKGEDGETSKGEGGV